MKNLRNTVALLAVAAACAPALALPTPAAAPAARLDDLAPAQLEAIYLHCARESSERQLGLGEAIACAGAGDLLKQRRFGGDFHALLAWWPASERERRAETPPPPEPEPPMP